MKSTKIDYSGHNLVISTESDKDFRNIVANSIDNSLKDTKRIGVIVDHLRGSLRDIALLDSYLIEIDGCYYGYNIPGTLLPIPGTDFDIYVKGTFSVFNKLLDGRRYVIYHTWLDESLIDNIEFERLIEYYRDGKCINLLEDFYGVTECYDIYLIIKNSKELIGAKYSHIHEDERERIKEMAGSDFVIYESTFSDSITPDDLGLATGIQIPIVRKVDNRYRIIRPIDFTGYIVKNSNELNSIDPIKTQISKGYSSYILFNQNGILQLNDNYLNTLLD